MAKNTGSGEDKAVDLVLQQAELFAASEGATA